MKTCCTCKEEKEETEFHRNNTRKDGLTSRCKQCAIRVVQERRKDPAYRARQCVWNSRWAAEHVEKVRAIKNECQKKKYRLLLKAGKISDVLRMFVYERDNQKCLSCGTSERLSIDHIQPISTGGRSDIDNLQTLCTSCNAKKQQATIDFRLSINMPER